MTQPAQCSKCGTTLPPDAPAGVCPKCLLAAGMGEFAEAAVGDATLITNPEVNVNRRDEPGTERDLAQSAKGPPVGTTLRYFGDYELLDEIARGGMGVVYKARQVRLNRVVALKMILAGTAAGEADIRRFQIEAEAAAQLEHPGIVPIFEVGEFEGRHFFSMGLIEGDSLAARLTESPLPAQQAARLIQQVAEAVQFAHDNGVVHRDLKPANILLDRSDQPHVTDFGLAKQVKGDSQITATGQILGTPSYMPPEQASGRTDQVGRLADVYSLGAVLYAALTGRPPFAADNPLDTLMQVMEREPLSPRQLNPAIPRDLVTICLKCLEKDRRKRYSSAGELSADLERFLNNEPIVARPTRWPERMGKWCRRRPAAASLIGVLLLALAGGILGASWHLKTVTAERNRANAGWRQAEAQQEIAEEQRSVAEQQQRLAEERELTARRYLYISDLQLATQAWEANNISRVLELLARHDPREGQADLRSFEWHYLQRLVNSARAVQSDHESGVYCVRYSPDGSRIVSTALNDKSLRIRDGQSGKTIAVLNGEAGIVRDAVFSIDGSQVISCGKDKTIRVWDVATATEVDSMNTDVSPLRVVRSKDGRRIAVAGDGGVEVWSLETRQRLQQIKVGVSGAVAFAPDGTTLAFGSVRQTDGQSTRGAVLWDLETEQQTAFLAGHTKALLRIEYSDDGRLMVTCGGDGTAQLWRMPDQTLLQTLRGHEMSVTDVAISSDKTRVVTVGNDKTVRVWNTADGRQLQLFRGHRDIVYGVDLHPDGHTVVTGSKDGSVRIWTLGRHAEVAKFRADEEGAIRQVAFLSNGQLLTGSSTGRLLVRDPSTGQQTKQLGGVRGVTMSLMSVPGDEPRVAACGLGSPSIELFSLADASRTSVELEARGLRFTVSPDTTQAAAVDARGRVSVVDLTTGKQTFMDGSHQGPVYAVTWHPNGDQFATGSYDTTIRLWNASSGRQLSQLTDHELAVVGLAFSSDGSLLASGSASAIEMDQRRDPRTPGTIRLWDLTPPTPVGRVITGHSGGVLALAFSPDDRTLVSAGHDATVRLWDPVTGSQKMRFAGDGGRFWCVTFSADGSQLAAGSDDGSVYVWSATRP